MTDFRNCTAEEGLSELLSLVCRSSLFSGEGAEELRSLLFALHQNDLFLTQYHYHRLTRALVEASPRRVSGDLFRDYLLHLLLHEAHPFAKAAAMGSVDEALHMYMGDELDVLGELSTLRGEDLVRMILERQRELQRRSRQGGDEISMLTASLWSRSQSPVKTPASESRTGLFSFLPPKTQWAQWHYGKEGLRDDYAADPGLEPLYAKLLSNSRWRDCLEDLLSFFRAYGCGGLLRCRRFYSDGRSLKPLPETFFAASAPQEIPEALKRALEDFSEGKAASPFFLYEEETAKGINCLPAQLEAVGDGELRLVFVAKNAPLLPLMEELAQQPLRFVICRETSDPLREVSELLCPALVPKNLLFLLYSPDAESPSGTVGL